MAEIRRFLDGRGYVEVETPMMQPIAGGAVARPFVTHHNALDIDLYLRIAPELYLKRLVVGGLEKVYEINRNFRNEGISAMHNPEFTMLEFYTAYHDVDAVMAITEEIIAAAATRVAGARPVVFKEREVSFRRPFARLTMKDGGAARGRRRRAWPSTPGDLDDPARLARLGRLRRPAGAAQRARARPWAPSATRVSPTASSSPSSSRTWPSTRIWDPTFITDYPTEVSPLSKARPDDPTTTERFELYVAGMEIANGFSELNDPLEQRDRFLEQLGERDEGRRRGPPDGRRLRPRARPRHAAHGRLRRRHRPPDHGAHDSPVDPRRDPVPAHAPGEPAA